MERIASLSEVEEGVVELEERRFLTAEATVIEDGGDRTERKRGEAK